MKKKYLLLVLMVLSLGSGCVKEDLYNARNNGDYTLTLNLKSMGNIIETRAVSKPEEENKIYNAYVIIFNSKGEKVYYTYRKDLNGNSNITITDIKSVLSGKNMTIAVVANIDENNSVMNVSKASLDAIETKDELKNYVAEMQSNDEDFFPIERGTSFLMSGINENVDLTDKTNYNVNLHRVDAKIEFKIKTGTVDGNSVKFTPTKWRVVSVPKKMDLFSNEGNDKFAGDNKNYFTSEWDNYDTEEEEGLVAKFSFYTLESFLTAKKHIPSKNEGLDIPVVDGKIVEEKTYRYSLRDKQLKYENGTNQEEFEYARDVATYVEFKGHVRYKDGNNQEYAADVKYMVHLGGIEKGEINVDNYSSKRNTSYTYNINICGVDKIIVEVETGDIEYRPGAEGQVVLADNIIELDAPNNIRIIEFNEDNIDESLTWNVSTPFSKGGPSQNVNDYKWILFRIGVKTGDNYSDYFNTYSGDKAVYNIELNSENIDEFIETYANDIKDKKDNMLNIAQLVEVVKYTKTLDGNSNLRKAFWTTEGKLRFTAFINEYYYEEDPNNANIKVTNGLWKEFVDRDKRVLNILSEIKVSDDGMSSKSRAIYSIRQSSIQTMYDKDNSDNGWGSQVMTDETPLPYDSKEYSSGNVPDNWKSEDNGRSNSVNMWDVVNNNKSWSTYVTQNTWKMTSNYEYAKYQCLKLNRDNSGDGIIQTNEMQWYLASINQLTDLWIGEESYSPEARLYKPSSQGWTDENENEDRNKEWYVSSTVPSRFKYTYWFSDKYRDRPKILYSSQGSSIGDLRQMTDVVYYRCVRNLGLDKDESPNTEPNKLIEYNANTRIMDMSRLDRNSIRGYSTKTYLPSHNERESDNKPWRKFHVSDNITNGYKNLSVIMSESQPGNAGGPCPSGYHVPNQRELAIMYSRMPKNDTTWPGNTGDGYFFSITSFSEAAHRPGFGIRATGDNYILLNGSPSGRVRCVKDID